jgi:hypothetical protein
MKKNRILTQAKSHYVGFRVTNDDRITGDDVLITLKELFGLMEKVSNKIGSRITESEWESWTSGFHAEIQEQVELALKHREGLE